MKNFAAISLCVFLSTPAFAQQQAEPTSVQALPAATFLDSLGVNTHVAQGYNPSNYVAPLQYLGVHNIRDSARNLSGYFMLHEKVGARVDLICAQLLDATSAGETLAQNDTLMAIEGPNEPNNWPITYNGLKGGGNGDWKPVAQFQADLYAAVKSDPVLKKYPVFHVSEGGAEANNVGMQFLTIPANAHIEFPTGTKFADFANTHNYVSGHSGKYVDNEAWNAADPTLNGEWDSLYGDYGKTWRGKFQGYSDEELQKLPRVSTETGWDTGNNPSMEHTQGVVLSSTYLSQFKRGWHYTFIYELADGEGGNGNQGLYRKDWTPKPAADFIHNMTTILADKGTIAHPGSLTYSIANQPATVHDLLLQKKNGGFYLVVWDEKATGSDDVTIDLGGSKDQVNIYDITSGSKPVLTKTNVTQLPVTLSDHAVILEIPTQAK